MRKYVKIVTVNLLLGMMLFGYTNCSSPKTNSDEAVLSPDNNGGSSGNGNIPPVQGSDACESALMTLYARGYHQFAKANCVLCHANGPGKGKFANSDVYVAFPEFQGIGYSLISNNAVSATHNSPYTGSQHIGTIAELKTEWQKGLADFDTCRGQISNPSPTATIRYETTKKVSPLTAAKTADKIIWNLPTELTAVEAGAVLPSAPGGKLEIAVSSGRTAEGEQYYLFSQPRIYGSSTDLHLKRMYVKINNRLLNYQTTFRYMDAKVYASTVSSSASLLSTGTLVIPGALSSADQISLGFESIQTVVLPNPPAPLLVQFDGGVVRDTVSGSSFLDVDVVLSRDSTDSTIVNVDLLNDTQTCFKDVTNANVSTSYKTIGGATCFQEVKDAVCPGGTCAADTLSMGRARPKQGVTFNRFDWDYSFTATALVFAPHEMRKTIRIPISTDVRKEKNRLLSLSINGVTGVAQVGTAAKIHVVFKKLNNPAPTLGVATFSELMRAGTGILAQNCLECHNSNTLAGGYDMANFGLMLQNQVLVPGNPANSKMFIRLNPNDPKAQGLQPMPLTGFMDPELVAEVRKWILDGAKNN